MPIIRALVADKKYSVRFLTRDPASPTGHRPARTRQRLHPGRLVRRRSVLREGFRGCDGAFINIDGFNTGEKTETYWAIRSYEIAIEEGIKFFVYGNLDYGLKKSGYDSRFRTGHYDGKGRVGEWILFQNQVNSDRMGAAVFTSGPYIEMVISPGTPMTPTVEDGVVDVACSARRGSGAARVARGLRITTFAGSSTIPSARMAWTSKSLSTMSPTPISPRRSRRSPGIRRGTSTPIWTRTGETVHSAASPITPAGYNADPKDKSTMSVRDNFTGFWNLWKYRVVNRDYALLDEIHPEPDQECRGVVQA